MKKNINIFFGRFSSSWNEKKNNVVKKKKTNVLLPLFLV